MIGQTISYDEITEKFGEGEHKYVKNLMGRPVRSLKVSI